MASKDIHLAVAENRSATRQRPASGHREFEFYFFGLRAGLSNLWSNRLALGVKKTIGKISQPINSHTRFPEYDHFLNAIDIYLSDRAPGRAIRILDVGSPKLFGLYLAVKRPVEIALTDISPLNLNEYRTMWQSLNSRSLGRAYFCLQDARRLSFKSAEFDIVYSMSVIEHVDGMGGDENAVEEMLRVLRPGGLLVISVPFGNKLIEQQRIGFSGAVRETGNLERYFFQRIYDIATVEKLILKHKEQLEVVTLKTVWREHASLHRAFSSLGQNFRGLLGVANPFLSRIVNRSCSGVNQDFRVQYGPLHAARDVYGDLIVVCRKS